MNTARPVQAALTSAVTFATGAALPLLVAAIAPVRAIPWSVSIASLVFLAFLGAVAARAGGASIAKGALRMTFWGVLAMGVTAGIGALFGTAV